MPTSGVKEVSARQIDSQTVNLQWFPPKDDQQNIKFYILSYQEVDKDRNPIKDPKEVVLAEDLTYDLKELAIGTEYEIKVFVANSEGRGPASSPIYVTLDKDSKDLPRK